MKRVAHEMRNQLAVAVANIEAFIDGKLEPTPRRLGAVLQALHELDALIDDVGGPAAVRMDNDPRVVDICAIITNEILAIEAATAEKRLTFSVDQCPATHAACRSFAVDPVRIGQVLKNLLLNAVRYTPAGGEVAVECRRDGGHFVFSVANDGPGIAPADLPHVFEAGYRVAAGEFVPGSGMGLTVARQMVEAHGGTISVESIPNERTTFTVRLPDENERGALTVLSAG